MGVNMKITCAICKNELDVGATRIVKIKGKDWACRECLKKANLSVFSSSGKSANEIISLIQKDFNNTSDNNSTEQGTNDDSSVITNEIRYVLKGTNGQLYVYDNKIEITRKGFFALAYQGLKGSKTIPISEIKSIQVKPCGFTIGYIQFGIGGGMESRGGLKDAHSDENTITFSTTKDNRIAQNIKMYIENLLFNKSNVQTVINQTVSTADEIKKYKELLDEGVISKEEFNAKKKQLLGL